MGRVLKRCTAAAVLMFLVGTYVAFSSEFRVAADRGHENAVRNYEEGRFFSASQEFDALPGAFRHELIVRHDSAMSLLRGSFYGRAIGEFQKIAIAGNDARFQADAHYKIAWAYVAAANENGSPYTLALAALQEALRLDPSHFGAKRLWELIQHIAKDENPDDDPQRKINPANKPGTSPKPAKP